MLKNFRIEIKWAIIFSVVSLIWFAAEKILGLHDNNISKQMVVSYFFIIPSVLVYYFGISDKKKNVFQGNMDWVQGMVCGVYLSFFAAIFSLLINFICFTFISPNYFQNMSAYVISTNAMTTASAADYFTIKSYLIQGVFGALCFGTVTSGIVAFFLKTKILKPS